MLFARFLAENHLLMHPDGVAVSLRECEELAPEEGAADGWELAERYAARTLPQIFRPDAAVVQLALAPEYRQKLEARLDSLPAEVFTASDALGWVYQFWQSKKKNEINKSEVKIGADELRAVTQLFTEPYMVQFLLHNTLGAWWVSRHPGETPPVEFAYLRRLDDGTPAAGTFPGWPDTTKELRILDPCCGSGHFPVTAFHILVPLRMAEEGLSARQACEAVLRDNLYGLEIDERCTQIAAFNLALAAWTFPGAGGYRELPRMNLACSGIPVSGKREEWLALANGNQRLKNGMDQLYTLFKDAPTLGSLINLHRNGHGDLLIATFAELQPLLGQAVQREVAKHNEAATEVGIAAQGVARAAELLAGEYNLVATNVPYLTRTKQSETLKEFCEGRYAEAKHELATTFVERCVEFCCRGGTIAVVTPQNWLFLTSYKKLRVKLLREAEWDLVAFLGPAAFEDMNWWAANTQLLVLSKRPAEARHLLSGVDVSPPRVPVEKAALLRAKNLETVDQSALSRNPDARITLASVSTGPFLSEYATSFHGLTTGDLPRMERTFWELRQIQEDWVYFQSSVNETCPYGGRTSVLYWCGGRGAIAELPGARKDGQPAWGRRGVLVRQMRTLPATLYCGDAFDENGAALIPTNPSHLAAIWAYCSSPDYCQAVRAIDQKTNVTSATLVKVPFELKHWQKVAEERGPLPGLNSDAPTQWLFNGRVTPSGAPLQVGVARLLGYRWPEQVSDGLDEFTDDDGIVCIPAVRGEQPAAIRLQALLAMAYGENWSAAQMERLLAEVGYAGTSLETWLRDGFFEQHCELFHQRPFIWHIWDGRRRDGFAALVNYHRLDRRRLETLTYAHLGDWIRTQEDGVKQGKDGADARLAAAKTLQEKLRLILDGEAPYDIFVRWKPIDQQPLGWEPDLNDGVRLNIRPFVTADVLRKKPKINWNKDRGKDPAGAPWGPERINDRHLTLAEKRAARAARGAA